MSLAVLIKILSEGNHIRQVKLIKEELSVINAAEGGVQTAADSEIPGHLRTAFFRLIISIFFLFINHHIFIDLIHSNVI